MAIALQDLRVLVIEDDLSESVDILMKLNNIGVTQITAVTTFEESVIKIREDKFDLAFVDVLLNHQEKGEDIAQQLTLKDTPFIITTNLTDLSIFYGLKKFSPLAYFQKPIDPLELRLRVEAFCDDSKQTTAKYLFHKNGNDYVRIDKGDIIYIEADGNYVTVFTEKEKFFLRGSLKTLLQKIDSTKFMQVHRKWIIRLDLIDSYNSQTKKAVIGELEFPVGRKFQSELTRYLVEV